MSDTISTSKHKPAGKHIFISYQSGERDYVAKLSQTLRDNGYTVWMDAESIPGSANWEKAIRTGLDEAQVVIAIMTDEGDDSPWVQKELYYAENLRKPIVPLLRRGNVWFRLSHLQAINAQRTSLNQPLPDGLLDVLAMHFNAAPIGHSAPRNAVSAKKPVVSGVMILLVLVILTIFTVGGVLISNNNANDAAASATNFQQTAAELGATQTINVAVSATFYKRTDIARETRIHQQIADTTSTAP